MVPAPYLSTAHLLGIVLREKTPSIEGVSQTRVAPRTKITIDARGIPYGDDAAALARALITAGAAARGQAIAASPESNDEAGILAARVSAAGRKRRGEA
jgi:hypothetical protein